MDWSAPEESPGNGIYVGSMEGGAPKLVSSDLSGNTAFAQGQVLYVRDRSLMAQPFDPDRMEFTGTAVPIADQSLIKDPGFQHAGFSVSQTGILVLQSTAAFSPRLLWFDRSGKEIG